MRGSWKIKVFVLFALVFAFLTPFASAEQREFTQEEREEVSFFVLGNMVFALYHELGHALVDQLEIPVLGREEDAVDTLATLLMLPEEADDIADEMILAAADGYAMASAMEGVGELAYWGEHSMDLQRFASVICLVYGSDPDGFRELAEELEMPQSERDRCPFTYDQAIDNWEALLEPYRADGGGSSGRIELTFESGPNVDPALIDFLDSAGVFHEAVDIIGYEFDLPRPIQVSFKSCQAVNAYYHPDTASVTICYELAEFFRNLIVADILQR